MADIAPINGSSYASTPPAHRQSAAEPEAPRRSIDDAVELSDRARYLGQLKQLPEVREDLVARVRAEIEAGTYETTEKLNTAIERLSLDLEA
jgi:negative regulator of flagellin synthesis FlgM